MTGVRKVPARRAGRGGREPARVASGRSIRWAHSRGALLVLLVLLSLLGSLLYAGGMWGVVLVTLARGGGLVALWLTAAAGLGALTLELVLSRPRPGGAGESDAAAWPAVAAPALGLGILSLAILGLGLLGWLRWASGWGVLVGGLAAGAIWLARRGAGVFAALSAWLEAPAGWEWLLLLAAPFLAQAMVGSTTPPGILWKPQEPHGYDVVEYHLQCPREWFEAARIVPLRHNAYGYFPFNVEMHYLLAMHLSGGPWAAMYAAQLMHLAYLALAVLAVHGVARRVAGPAPAALAAAAMLAVPWITQLAAIAYDEGGFLLYATLAIGSALSAMSQPVPRWRSMAVAGAMAGFAAGSKLTAVPEVLLGVPLVFGAVAVAQRLFGVRPRAARPFSQLLLFGIFGLLTFSPWLIRNALWTHNPLFPELMPLLGHGDFSPVQVERWERAHQAVAGQQSTLARVGAFWREIVLGWQFGYFLLPAGVIGFLLSIRRWAAWPLLGLLALLAGFWLFKTHLQARFFILAAPLCALLIAQGMSRVESTRIRRFVAALIVLASGIGWRGIHVRLAERLYGDAEHPQGILPGLGETELNHLFLDEILPPDFSPDATLCLVGDAQAFWYPLPMRRLRYRTVFDVRNDQPDLVNAWLGDEALPPNSWMLIDPAELRRLSESYWELPALPADIARRHGRYVERVNRAADGRRATTPARQ